MTNKISVYIILYHDLGFLDDIINLIFSDVDEIVLVDGPYSYNIETFKKLNLFYDETNKPQELINIINKYSSKIKYFYNIFKNEEEKRIFGYKICSNNILLLVDTDEFFILDINKIKFFINSNKYVGGFSIYNMNRTDIYFDNKVTKFVIFKKDNISPIQHLDYTWLIGCKQNKLNEEFILLNNDLGIIYHQTLNRTKFNNIIKFIFYICLYNHLQTNEKSILEDYKIDDLLQIIKLEVLLDIFYHSKQDLIGIPPDINKIWMPKNDILINLDKYKNNYIDAYFKNNSIALKNINYYCYLNLVNNNFTQIIITFDNVKNINVNLYEINCNEKIIINSYYFNNINENQIIIDYNFIKKTNYLNLLIMLKCNETIENSFIYNIKNIIFN
jgi:hypothetical protein